MEQNFLNQVSKDLGIDMTQIQGSQSQDPKNLQDIDIKAVQQLFQEVHSIPKIELHSHIGGCIRPETFLELAEKKGISVEHLDFYNVDIKMAFEIFKVGSKLVTDIPTLKRVVKEIIQDYQKHNTRYLELRSTPKDFQNSSKIDYINTVIDAMKEGEEENNLIKVRLLLSINRLMTEEQAQEIVDIALKYQKEPGPQYVVGIELSGDPRQGQLSTFIPALTRAKENKVKISLHCSEVKEQENENEDFLEFKPDRLGHCIFLTDEQIKRVEKEQIPVEICPSSNVAAAQCYAVQFLKHLKEFQKLKHNIVICCDDTLLFGTNLSNELFEYAKAVSIVIKDVKELLIRNVDAIFDDGEKEWLRDQIVKYQC